MIHLRLKENETYTDINQVNYTTTCLVIDQITLNLREKKINFTINLFLTKELYSLYLSNPNLPPYVQYSFSAEGLTYENYFTIDSVNLYEDIVYQCYRFLIELPNNSSEIDLTKFVIYENIE